MSPHVDDQPRGQVPDEPPQDTWQRLALISQLLQHAARQVWARADEEGPASGLQSFGLGIYLAHAQAHQLLPSDDNAVDVELVGDDRTVLQLIAEAEELGRPLAREQADLMHGSQLVSDLCDLIREAQHNGC
jgi:hypothetical protein